MSAEPYTSDEMTDDLTDWQSATVEQRSHGFHHLMAAATAVAFIDQNRTLIETLREIRTERDGVAL